MITVNNSRCLKCSGCVGICPVSALTLKDRLECDKRCTDCGLCVTFCPIGALSIERRGNVPKDARKS